MRNIYVSTIVLSKILRSKDITLLCMQRNLVISPAAARSSIEITEIDLCSALFAYNNVFIALLNYMQYKLTFTY